MTVADTGLADVWPISAIADRGHDIRARFASNLSDRPAPAADGFFWFRCPQPC